MATCKKYKKGEQKECLTCKKGFYVYPYRILKSKFCSQRCYWIDKKENKQALKNLAFARQKNAKNPVWNKGKRGVQEGWGKGQSRPEIKGKNNPNWKGGKRSERKIAMGRIEYILWRSSVFMRDDYVCQICNERGGKLEADHIKPWALYPELRYAIDNGRTLCKDCHRQTDTWGFKTSRASMKGELS